MLVLQPERQAQETELHGYVAPVMLFLSTFLWQDGAESQGRLTRAVVDLQFAKTIARLGFPQEFKVSSSRIKQHLHVLMLSEWTLTVFPDAQEFKVQNIVGSCDVKFPIRLEGLSYTHRLFCSVCSPCSSCYIFVILVQSESNMLLRLTACFM